MAGPFLFIFTGTGGSGRKTIGHRIGQELGLYSIQSCTTRPPRAPERGTPDRDYRFLSREAFEAKQHNGEFIETAVIGHEQYGILRNDLERPLQEKRNAYVIVNPEGAEALKQRYGNSAIRIFIYVDKMTVRERLEAKGMSFEVVDRYLVTYSEEVVYRKQCEHVIENTDLLRTLARIREAIQSHL
ncbi:guanylate kinase [Paenibacillus curdlanolyticus YK9]|uniref:Guanylate kinase n=1 Tax=Paenibacillus curdlanolyticus YK9 TaxID=717606 RepID=E0I6V9_9BACL|nr:guanylate kinase [Paenibacillus curdlanolyticus]EFM11775.1 guanylate kinase [Paenibacillus curdlanolyticus YK9]